LICAPLVALCREVAGSGGDQLVHGRTRTRAETPEKKELEMPPGQKQTKEDRANMSADDLLKLIQETLVEQGMKFDVRLEDVLRSVLEEIESGGKFKVAASMRASLGGTMKDQRAMIIASASREYGNENLLQGLTSRQAYVNGALREENHNGLTEEEVLYLPVR
jgi:hypothetical protein